MRVYEVKISIFLVSSGVGLFVCLHGVVAREVRGQAVTRVTIRQYFSGVLLIIRSVIPLVVLGCARLMATRGVEYQEHVSEYGVHWNFFFTLAVVKVHNNVCYSWDACVCMYVCMYALSVKLTQYYGISTDSVSSLVV